MNTLRLLTAGALVMALLILAGCGDDHDSDGSEHSESEDGEESGTQYGKDETHDDSHAAALDRLGR